MAGNDEKELKTIKFQMMLSPGEAEQIDEWMFKRRIKSRAEAIRRLCQIAMLVSDNHEQLSSDILKMNQLVSSRIDKTGDQGPESFINDAFPEVYGVLGRSLSIAAMAREMESGGSLAEALKRRDVIQRDVDNFIAELEALRIDRDNKLAEKKD